MSSNPAAADVLARLIVHGTRVRFEVEHEGTRWEVDLMAADQVVGDEAAASAMEASAASNGLAAASRVPAFVMVTPVGAADELAPDGKGEPNAFAQFFGAGEG